MSESDVSLNEIFRFSLRRIGVSCFDGATCGADGPVVIGWVGGAASGTGGLKWRTRVKSDQLIKASLCFGLRLGIRILSARATLLEVDIQDLPDEMTLTSSDCCLFRLIFLLPRFLRTKSFR